MSPRDGGGRGGLDPVMEAAAALGDWEAAAAQGLAWEALLAEEAAARPRARGRGRATGAFYTPAALARALVEGALGLRGGLPAEVLDPACGAGALLAAAFDALVARGASPGDAARRLYGVDLDAGALALARRALCLRAAALGAEEAPVRAHLLAHLRRGDALADPPAGAFDLVVANPPYLFERSGGITREARAALRARYRAAAAQLTTYPLFIEAALGALRPGGSLGFLVPANHLSIPTQAPLRRVLLAEASALRWVRHDYPAIPGAEVDTCLLLATRRASGEAGAARLSLATSPAPGEIVEVGSVAAEGLTPGAGISFSLAARPAAAAALKAMARGCIPLGEMASVRAGLKAYEVGRGIPPQSRAMKDARVYHADAPATPGHRPYLRGQDVGRFDLRWSGQWLAYGPMLAAPREASLFEGPRILVRQIPARPPHAIRAAFAAGDEVHDVSIMVIQGPDEATLLRLLGLLCSSALSFWFEHTFDKLGRRIFPQFKVVELRQFLVPQEILDPTSPSGQALEAAVRARLGAPEAQALPLDGAIDALALRIYGLEVWNKEPSVVSNAHEAT